MPNKNIELRKAYHKKYHKKWYSINKEKRKQQIYDRKKLIRDWYKNYKSTLSCETCGESDSRCIEFHHKDPQQKKFNLGHYLIKGYSINNIFEEIKKCLVLCANCHRKETYK